jgi:hypothetical protein
LECGADVQDQRAIKVFDSDGATLSGENFDMIRLEMDGRLSVPIQPSSKGCVTASNLAGSKRLLVRNKSTLRKQSVVIDTNSIDLEKTESIKLSRISQTSPKFIDSQLPPLGDTLKWHYFTGHSSRYAFLELDRRLVANG